MRLSLLQPGVGFRSLAMGRRPIGDGWPHPSEVFGFLARNASRRRTSRSAFALGYCPRSQAARVDRLRVQRVGAPLEVHPRSAVSPFAHVVLERSEDTDDLIVPAEVDHNGVPTSGFNKSRLERGERRLYFYRRLRARSADRHRLHLTGDAARGGTCAAYTFCGDSLTLRFQAVRFPVRT